MIRWYTPAPALPPGYATPAASLKSAVLSRPAAGRYLSFFTNAWLCGVPSVLYNWPIPPIAA